MKTNSDRVSNIWLIWIFLLSIVSLICGTLIEIFSWKGDVLNTKLQELWQQQWYVFALEMVQNVELWKAKEKVVLLESQLKETKEKHNLISQRYKSFKDLIELNKKALAVNID